MKKLITIFLFLIFGITTYSQVVITPGMTGLQLRNALNDNFSAAYDSLVVHNAKIMAKAMMANPHIVGLIILNTDTVATRAYARAIGGGGGGGGGGTWGSITGSINDQTDLLNAFNLKANLASPSFTGTVSGITSAMVGLGNVTNESKATMFTNSILTGSPTIAGYVPTSLQINGHPLTGSISVTASDVGLGNVTNESKATMFTSATGTGTWTLPATTSIGTVSSTEIGYLDNVTSSLQTQINAKANTANPTFTTGITTPQITLGSTLLTSTGTELNNVTGTTSPIQTQLNNTLDLDSALLTASTRAIIQAQIDASLASYGGGSGVTHEYKLIGRVGDTGFPVAGDSLVINSGFITHPYIAEFNRNGNILQQHTDNTQSNGFRFDGGTGTITVKPVFGTNEQITITAREPVVVHYLTPEGGAGAGGSPPDTPLQDSLLAVWEMDETSGTTVIDALGVNNGTTTATVNQTGKLGKSKLYNGITYSVIPNSATLIPDGDEMSISVWFYLTQLPSVAGHVMELVTLRDAQTPYYTAKLYLQATDNIAFYVTNSTGTVYEFETAASAVATGQWYHLDAVNEGAGEDAKIYLNGTNICSYHPAAFTGSLLQFDSVVYLGNRNDTEEYGEVGYMDQVRIYKQAHTGGFVGSDVSLLFKSGLGSIYPDTE